MTLELFTKQFLMSTFLFLGALAVTLGNVESKSDYAQKLELNKITTEEFIANN